MVRQMLVLIMLSFLLGIGGVWALRAQDPAPQKPATTTTEPQTTQIDLSGTYAGTFKCEAAGLMGDTTLTINGNEFTTSDGRTGRITTSKTKGYTAVAFQVNGADPNSPSTIISLRAKKSGNKLTLTSIAGSTKECMFTPSKNVAKSKQTTPAATGTDVANPASTPSAMPSQSPRPSPSPEASPTPSGSPTPLPAPTASPSPSPGEPTPSPTPSPSPSPRP